MNRLHRRTRSAAALAVVLGLLAAGCGSSKKAATSNAPVPGVTATSITVGSHQPLTGVAAPGYSEIAPASQAYFDYVNAHGGVYGRKITDKYLDDGYNPSNTKTVVEQLVNQDQVFAIFDGLGTPTHLAVEPFLNASKVPDLFVASGCTCWNQPGTYPETFGWQPDYTVEGEIQGQYVNNAYANEKVGYFLQNDDFGSDGAKGLDTQIPKANVVSRQTYDPTNIDVSAQILALQAAHAQVVVSYSVPAFTALALLTAAKIGFAPTWVVSNVGSDPITLTGLLSNFSKGAAGGSLINGIVSDTYLPSLGDTGNGWIKLFTQIHDQYISKLPMDGNVLYGMSVAYTFVQALFNAGPNPTRANIVSAISAKRLADGPGVVPYSYSSSNHQGLSGVQMGTITNGAISLTGTAETATDTGNIQSYTTTPAGPPASGIPSARS
jgi:ABC-type branched-subunit amino acid transport system substrate-binding protein